MATPEQIQSLEQNMLRHDVNGNPLPRTVATKSLPNGHATPFEETFALDVHSTISDCLSAAWNGWETAVKFHDDEKQDYYMKYIKALSEFMIKFRKL